MNGALTVAGASAFDQLSARTLSVDQLLVAGVPVSGGGGGGGGGGSGGGVAADSFAVAHIVGAGPGSSVTVDGYLIAPNARADYLLSDTIRVTRLIADEIIGGVILAADPDDPNAVGGGGTGTGGAITQDVQATTVRADAVYSRVVEADEIYCPVIVGGTRLEAQCDKRVKSKVSPLSGDVAARALSEVSAYTYLKDGDEEVGFIAQEVEEVLPAAVTCRRVGAIADFKCLDVKAMVAVLWSVVQRQQDEIRELRTLRRPGGGGAASP